MKKIAVLDDTQIIAINNHNDDYVVAANEQEVTDVAFVGGFFINDAFIPPQPFPSWTLNETTCLWEPPTPHPDDGNLYSWSEDDHQWQPA